jgi:two-component sensor histidine kinase
MDEEPVTQLLWRADPAGGWSWVSPHFSRYTGLEPGACLGSGWLFALHPQDRDAQQRLWRLEGRAQPFHASCRLLEKEAQRYRRFQSHVCPLLNDAGRVVEWLGSAIELDAVRQRQSDELLALRHRMRNMLSVIRSIAQRTARNSSSQEYLAMHLEGRLDALSRIHAALMLTNGQGVDFGQLIADELLAHSAQEGARLRLDGPAVRLPDRTAEVLGLAVHELASNAVKFGALLDLGGSLSVEWRRNGDGSLTLVWKERGRPARAVPGRRGFGLELLESRVPYELQARVAFALEADGARCEIALPAIHLCSD